MAVVSYGAMRDALVAAGFHGIQIPVMIAIALAESGGDSSNVGDSGQSYGLWQIYQPVWGNQFPVNCAVDTTCAAKAAWTISNHGSNFNPWTVFRAAVNPDSLPPELRANKFTNYLPQVLDYFHIPRSTDWASELEKLGHGAIDTVKDAFQDIIDGLPDWAKTAADKVTPDGITACGIPDATFDVSKQAEWFYCIGQHAADSAVGSVVDQFKGLLPSIENVQNAIVVGSLLILGGVFIYIGGSGLVRNTDTFKQLQSTATKAVAVA
jgi:Lysozyme like domain